MNKHTHSARREKLRPLLAREGLDALLVSLAANRFYLSGFELHDPQCNESAGYLLVTRNGPDWLLTDPRYLDAARRLWDEDNVFIYAQARNEKIREFLAGLRLGTIGVESQALCVQTWLDLSNGLTLKPTKGLVEELRIIKEPGEIEIIRRSCRLNHEVFGLTPRLLVPGKTEEALAWELEQAFRNGGASELSFETIVGVGPNAALPHAIPGTTAIRENELVLVDMGCRLGAYCSDQTRTFWVGDKPSERFQHTMELVRGAQQAAIDIIRPGLPAREAYLAAWNHLDRHGVASQFTHGLGHGIGLETHEPPSLGRLAETTLQPGMFVTVEPGLYDPTWGGIRWEYMVLVTENGCEIL
ncbi:M24 family metallopeptidase [Desulfocurvibacter africanus]|uniref:Peptidase M24 n=1 Tax=Desulfocurvibacter africanus subsp. africanus str. Walvis Bay TaxID=690850 RepID=F3YYK3_DESAF|nr:Xaa-Pro peptidase family protein [Desulfocurvibacter africanus]EGJ50757.1 peptidase M24 [Desulfocurvibacter africanus subsp. africanus str. Walvis Bay]